MHKILIDGLMPRWAHPYFVTQRLIGLGEKERPVCIGEYVVRSCSAFVNKAVSAQKDRVFFMKMVEERYALQLGNAVPGQEVVVHLLNTLVHEPGAKRVVLSDDGKNAYNATDRVGACNRTMSENPVCARWVAWCYGTNAMLVNDAGVVWGKEGVFQGDPLTIGRSYSRYGLSAGSRACGEKDSRPLPQLTCARDRVSR